MWCESHQLKYAYTWMALPTEASPFKNWCNPFLNWTECNSVLSDANFLPGFEVYFSLHFGTNGVLCCCGTMWNYDDCMRVRYLSIGSVPGRKKSLKNETLFLRRILFLWCTDVQNHCYFTISFIVLAADCLHLITITLVLSCTYILYPFMLSLYIILAL